jgi:osmoprotectant transport system ATP-binding protein
VSDPATENPVLELRGVHKRFGATRALAETSLSLSPGHTLALIGPSGCGKTTLLRTVLGLITPDGGEVFFEGERLDAHNALQLRTRMGYVVQDGGLFPHLTAERNVTLMARHLRRPEREIGERCAELAELARLPASALARYPAELSGGQRQRVGLMRALMLDPVLLLLDEPLAAIDPLVRAELQDDLAAIFHALRKAVVLVTHDLSEAAFFAHELALMQDGAIVQRGSFAELRDAPSDPFVTRFVQAQRRSVRPGPA